MSSEGGGVLGLAYSFWWGVVSAVAGLEGMHGAEERTKTREGCQMGELWELKGGRFKSKAEHWAVCWSSVATWMAEVEAQGQVFGLQWGDCELQPAWRSVWTRFRERCQIGDNFLCTEALEGEGGSWGSQRVLRLVVRFRLASGGWGGCGSSGPCWCNDVEAQKAKTVDAHLGLRVETMMPWESVLYKFQAFLL